MSGLEVGIGGDLVKKFILHNLPKIQEIGKGVLKGAKDELRLTLEKTYKAYLEETLKKHTFTKSFFLRNSSVGLYEFYVPIALRMEKRTINDPNFSNLSESSKRIVVLGSGGCGKSILMKHLFISCISAQFQVPVFIELREYNNEKTTLMGLIEATLSSFSFDFDSIFIKKAIIKGHYAFIFDGFDEVSLKKRNKLIQDIQKLSKIGKGCTIIISSRPDDVFSGINEFDIYQVKNLSLTSACMLVEKLPFDGEIKKKFVDKLKQGLFEKHTSFLSNPLLLSIMLLTYGQNAEIPGKLTLFYNQAYEALFQRHDALKAGFKRERRTNLDIRDFERVFSTFCLQTYDKRQFAFSKTQALNYISKIGRHLSLDIPNECFLDDALKATCLLPAFGKRSKTLWNKL